MALHTIVAIDEDGNEALYVGGNLVEIEGDTVFACDIAAAVGDAVIQFSHVKVVLNPETPWPTRFENLFVHSDGNESCGLQ